MQSKVSTVLLLIWLLSSANTLSWQSYGNFTPDNMTFIMTYINNNADISWPYATLASSNNGDMKLANFSQSLSNALNNQWAMALNVFTFYHSSKIFYDAIVYGYAFRDHWMWYNGYQMNDGYSLSFVLWKDYNCINWKTYSHTNPSDTSAYTTFTGTDKDVILSILSNSALQLNVSEVWNAGKYFVQTIQANSQFTGHAFSIVTLQNSGYISGRFCHRNYYVLNARDANLKDLKSILIQTR